MIPPSKIKMQKVLHNDMIKKPRKIIQITTDTDATDSAFWGITALCDDGTVWQLPEYESGWNRVPDIPQGIETDNE